MKHCPHPRTALALGLLLPALLLGPPAAAQTFDSGSDGSDGALAFPPDAGTIVFDPSAFDPPLDPDGDNVYHFTTIDVPAGTTVRLRTREFGGEGRPVIWLASGAVTIGGIVDLDGGNGHGGTSTVVAAEAGAGGWGGGVGGTPVLPSGQAGNGPGGGGSAAARHGGGGGHALPGAPSTSTAGGIPGGEAYGNFFVLPLLGGSGGGGAGLNGSVVGSGGGAGGGALLVASSTSIRLDGVIRARGGSGGLRASNGRAGGGGSAGAVRLMAPTLSGAGAIDVRGGAGADSNAGNGAQGRVRLECFVRDGLTNMLPANAPTYGTPGLVLLPPAAPQVRVVRVAGVEVAVTPSGSFVVPDAVVETVGPVEVELAATRIPLGTVLQLTFQPEDGDAIEVTSTPLAGTQESSQATAEASLPSGFTRIFVRASWNP